MQRKQYYLRGVTTIGYGGRGGSTGANGGLGKPANLNDLVFKGMSSIERHASEGALVSLQELRSELSNHLISKQDFDNQILKMAQEGLVILARHDFPAKLTQKEKDQLIYDGKGNYYIAVSKL